MISGNLMKHYNAIERRFENIFSAQHHLNVSFLKLMIFKMFRLDKAYKRCIFLFYISREQVFRRFSRFQD